MEEYAICKSNVIRKANETNTNDAHMTKVAKIQQYLNFNEQQRLRIVESLGGAEVCENIPIICAPNLSDYMRFRLTDIPANHSVAQYEDRAGRKGVLMKLKNKKTGEEDIFWLNQRYRETCNMNPFNNGGGLWVADGVRNIHEAGKIADFINQIKSGSNELYELAA